MSCEQVPVRLTCHHGVLRRTLHTTTTQGCSMVRNTCMHLVEPHRLQRVYRCLLVVLVLACSCLQTNAVEEREGHGLRGDASNSNRQQGGASPSTPTWHQRRRLQQSTFTQLRPMSDTTKCLNLPGANYTDGNQFALAPCAAVPSQNFSLPAAGQVLQMYVGPVAAQKGLDLFQWLPAPGTPVVVSVASPLVGLAGLSLCSFPAHSPVKEAHSR